MTEAPIVSIKDLNVHLGTSHILHSVSLDITPGEVVALLGTNGSGKSTLVRALTSIIPSTSGRIELFGHRPGPKVPWHRVGYVPQRVTAQSGSPHHRAKLSHQDFYLVVESAFPKTRWTKPTKH